MFQVSEISWKRCGVYLFKGPSAYLFADNMKQLLDVARELKLPFRNLCGKNTLFPHFHLTRAKRQEAIRRLEAREASTEDVKRHIERKRSILFKKEELLG